MRVMGVDLSTKAGVAVVDSDEGILHAGLVTYPQMDGWARVNAIVGHILGIDDQYTPDAIYIEDYALGLNMGAVIVQVEISTVLQFILWQNGRTPHLVHPTTLKKFVAGNGGAKKELMLLEVYKRWGHSAKGNDEADAVALAHFGLAAQGSAINCTKPMLLIVDQWKSPPPPKPKKRAKSMT